MPKRPWELNDEEAEAEAKLIKDELREADTKASWLFCQQIALLKEQRDEEEEEEDA